MENKYNCEIANSMDIIHPICAACLGEYEQMQFLLKSNNSLIDSTDVFGNTLLIIAAKEGHKEIVELLLKKGANYFLKNKKGETFIDVATEKIKKIIKTKFTEIFETVKSSNNMGLI